MDTTFVKVNVDVECQWEGISPDYRIYITDSIDDEMLAERTYRWSEPFYLMEILQLEVRPLVVYTIRLEPIGPQLATFKLTNPRIELCKHPVRVMPHCDRPDTEFTIKVKP